LVDSERNSAVVSFNDNQHSSFFNSKIHNSYANSNQILATFRCQANTCRLEIKISSIEGQYGQFKAYILTKITPKSAQTRNYTIKALSLHKRKYFESKSKNDQIDEDGERKTLNNEFKLNTNSFVITGQFSLAEAYSWLYYVLPEIPDKISPSMSNENLVEFTFQSTLVNTYLKIQLTECRMYFESDNVSTISILKDFLTREATKRSIPVQLKLDLNRSTVNFVLTAIYAKLRVLIKHCNNLKLKVAIQEIETIDKAIAMKMSKEFDANEEKLKELGLRGDQNELERFYGLITDLFIDFEKLNGNNTKNMINIFKSKINEMIALTENYLSDEYNVEIFIQKITEFWHF
jgi:Bardet-Biedl syndrome 7 protein